MHPLRYLRGKGGKRYSGLRKGDGWVQRRLRVFGQGEESNIPDLQQALSAARSVHATEGSAGALGRANAEVAVWETRVGCPKPNPN